MNTLPEFRRDLFDPALRFTRIGNGEIGGKASALVSIQNVLQTHLLHSNFEITIPVFTVLSTDIFDSFIERNSLTEIGTSGVGDDAIAHEFQKAQFPVEVLGDLRGLIEKVRVPLAIRSSSLLEDSLGQPFAGIYTTKMIPNNSPSPDERFRKFLEAIKLIYASSFFEAARNYIRATGLDPKAEKMAVIVQEIAGKRRGDRFYPEISGVARSYNYYPSGRARPEDGVVSLALGLGKTIVDGELCWTYSPALPRVAPPAASAREFLSLTQTKFWAVNMGKPPAFDPVRETEYLLHLDLSTAESDDTLSLIASTYDPVSELLTPGTGRQGPRVLNFAGILQFKDIPLNDLIRSAMKVCAEDRQMPVEIEFAVTLNPNRFFFLQVRPMVVSTEHVEISDQDWSSDRVWIASNHALGNGATDSIADIVYVDPNGFDLKNSKAIAAEIAEINAQLLSEHRPYLLLGFGRWGSSDPWLGIPVNWGHVAGAKVIVEAALPGLHVDLSQGSHFFHNLISFRVAYISVHSFAQDRMEWDWLLEHPLADRKVYVRRVRLNQPIRVTIDGRSGKAIVLKSTS
jgi:hypothetical protein